MTEPDFRGPALPLMYVANDYGGGWNAFSLRTAEFASSQATCLIGCA